MWCIYVPTTKTLNIYELKWDGIYSCLINLYFKEVLLSMKWDRDIAWEHIYLIFFFSFLEKKYIYIYTKLVKLYFKEVDLSMKWDSRIVYIYLRDNEKAFVLSNKKSDSPLKKKKKNLICFMDPYFTFDNLC